MREGQKRLNQYKGRLTAAQIADGMNAAAENAKRLADASRVLLSQSDSALAASIASLSIEESGKVSILRALAVARTDGEVAECWRDYRSHTRKNAMWVLPELVAAGARRLADFRPMLDPDAEHPLLLDQIKQIGFYTDCLGRGHWSRPARAVGGQLASMLVETATVLPRAEPVTEREIELWIEHVGPVWKGSMESMEHGLLEWSRQMEREGLRARGESQKMEEFVLDGLWTGQEE
jgi:AbiV family abortive infection protein